jgi:hypothetical protein
MSVVSRTREERILIIQKNGERGFSGAGLGERCLMEHGVEVGDETVNGVEVGDETVKMDPCASRNSGDGSIERTGESMQSKYSA